jgi:hypothetical protein
MKNPVNLGQSLNSRVFEDGLSGDANEDESDVMYENAFVL